MDISLLVIALITLIYILKKIATLENVNAKSLTNEIKQNTIMMMWGILLVICLLFIPFQIWVITGSSNNWDGVYMIGASIIATLFICMAFYSKFKVNKQIDTFK